MFTVICDHCGCDMLDGEEYCAWNDSNAAVDYSGCHISDDDKHYCDYCLKGFDDDDKEILDETRKGLFNKGGEDE